MPSPALRGMGPRKGTITWWLAISGATFKVLPSLHKTEVSRHLGCEVRHTLNLLYTLIKI